tara:strand:+ start:69 stop:392 length:324 start_codon:yes stop_codon:yes gene_type:complete
MRNVKTKEEKINEMAEKHFNLVWFARRSPEQVEQYPSPAREQAMDALKEIERKFPDDVLRISSVDGDFWHGFNSGVLASLRLIQGLDAATTKEEEEAEFEEFPFLDT